MRASVVTLKPRSQIPLLLALFALQAETAHAQVQRVHRPRYELVEIPSLHPTGYAYAGGVNQRGDVCGTSMAPNGLSEHAFLFSDGVLTDAHTGWDTYSWGEALTDDRAVLGYSNVSNLVLHAFRWHAGVVTDLHGGPHDYSRTMSANRHGDHGGLVNGFFGGFVTRHRGYVDFGRPAITIIGTFGGDESRLEDLNDRRQAVGMARDTTGKLRAFLWESDTLFDLGDLGGGAAWARAINEAGTKVVGRSKVASGDFHAFLHSAGGMQDLGTLGGLESEARGINHQGWIVGAADRAGGLQRATIWIDGHAIDLDALVAEGTPWVLTGAHAINDLGQVVGTGQRNGVQRPYRLDPIEARPRHTPAQPSIAGLSATSHLRGATPGALVELWASTSTGQSTSACGSPLQLNAPVLVTSALADAEGRCEFTVQLTSNHQGLTVHTQAVDTQGCRTSSLVTQTID